MTATLTAPADSERATPIVMDEKPQRFRFTRDSVNRMAQDGFFEDENIELIDGSILTISPINEPRVSSVSMATETLRVLFYPGFTIRTQAPLDFGLDHQPQPDLSIIAGSAKGRRVTPTNALLVIEVAETSIGYDTGDKMSLYASAGILDYWVIDLKQQCIHVHRDPQDDPNQAFGKSYATRRIYTLGDRIVPLAAPDGGSVAVADLLP